MFRSSLEVVMIPWPSRRAIRAKEVHIRCRHARSKEWVLSALVLGIHCSALPSMGEPVQESLLLRTVLPWPAPLAASSSALESLFWVLVWQLQA